MRTIRKKIEKFDENFIYFLREYADVISRLALFIIFFWFGILKVFLISPAGPLVTNLLEVTFLGWIEPDVFLVWFGVLEVIIGILILIPRLERITFAILLFHLFTTVMPLFMISDQIWDGWFAPNLVGQYIIKNLALLSLGLVLFARLRPMTRTHSVIVKKENVL